MMISMKTVAASRHLAWFALAGLVVTTTADSPHLRSESDTTKRQSVDELLSIHELFEVVGTKAFDSLIADVSLDAFAFSSEGLLALQADSPETVSGTPFVSPSVLASLADNGSENQESAHGAANDGGFAIGGQFASSNGGFPTSVVHTNGTYWDGAPTIAVTAVSGGLLGDIDMRSRQPEREIATSPRTYGPGAVVPAAPRAFASIPSPAHAPTAPSFRIDKQDETPSHPFLIHESPESVSPAAVVPAAPRAFASIPTPAHPATSPSFRIDKQDETPSHPFLIHESPESVSPAAVVPAAPRAFASIPTQGHPATSPSFRIDTQDETPSHPFLTHELRESVSPSRISSIENGKVTDGLDLGQTPDVVAQVTALPFESQEPLAMGLREFEQLASDEARDHEVDQNLILAAVSPTLAFDAPAAPLSSAEVPTTIQIGQAVPEPATLALLGLGLAGLGLARRKQ